MPKIILTDDPGTQVGSTFLDDSFRDTNSYAPVVVARILAGADLRWHSEVVSRLARKSRELKASLVLKHLDELPADLQRAVKRTIREACVSILDARVYTFQFERMLSGLGEGLGSEGRSRIRQQFLGEFVRNSVLWDSPAWRIQRMLFPELSSSWRRRTACRARTRWMCRCSPCSRRSCAEDALGPAIRRS